MTTNKTEPETTEDGKELRNRRDRLEALKSRRANTAAAAPAAGAAAQGGFASAMAGGGDTAKRQRQKKLLMKVYKVMTQTPDDGRGMVDGTPFTEAGVERLMTMLESRTGESQVGAKVAEGVLNFITPSEGEDATSSGASVAKLQTIARRIDSFRGKAGGRRRQSW